jgi:tRNA(Ile)-lysidine synthase
MSRQQPLSRRVLQFIRRHSLVRENELLLVGVSGGPDSVCLLHVLGGLRSTLGLKLHIAHLNHMLRDAESDADADYVAALSHKLDIPATIERRGVKAYQKKNRLSGEEAAREVRYAFFSEVACSLGADTVAVGHTADDQVETILMNLVRGTGLAGLRGMRPLSPLRSVGGTQLRVVRPLLEVRRAETEAYCAARDLSPRNDSSNRLPDFLRNRIRSQLIPLLREYNPDIDKALTRMARAVDSDLAYIEAEVSRLWDSVASEQSGGIAIDRAEFSKLHLALKRHLVRSALQRLLGELKDIESVHIDSLVEALAKPAGKRLSLPKGLAFQGDYRCGLITAKKSSLSLPPALGDEHLLNIPGESEFCGWKIRSRILRHIPKRSDEGEMRACFDLDVVGRELIVRARQRGDRFQPLGMESPKKLQDFMVDAKISRHLRDHVPLVCSPQHILWVVGWRIDHRARVTSSTKHVLCLEFERVKGT